MDINKEIDLGFHRLKARWMYGDKLYIGDIEIAYYQEGTYGGFDVFEQYITPDYFISHHRKLENAKKVCVKIVHKYIKELKGRASE